MGGAPESDYFKSRNTYFVIYSLTSRNISEFSPYKETEREALFLPFSHFLIYKKELENGKNIIYMRQIELGLGIRNVLWVDDNIFNDKWENKSHIEYA